MMGGSKLYAILTVLAIILVPVAIYTVLSCQIVTAGYVGIEMHLGEIIGVLHPGLHLVPFGFNTVGYLPTQIKLMNGDASAASSDLQTVNANLAVNYQLVGSDKDMEELYGNFLGDHETRVIAPFIQESVKATTAKYTAEELITNRELVRENVESLLSSKLKPLKINVVAVSITNFDFSDQFNKAIELKAEAAQNKLRTQIELDQQIIEVQKQVAQANATRESAILQAEGDAQATVIRANAQAAAIENITHAMSTNPNYIPYLYASRWDGALPKIVTSGGMLLQIPADVTGNQMLAVPENVTVGNVTVKT
jgi:prohibitin 2